MVKLNTDLKLFALFEFAQTETAKMSPNRKNIFNHLAQAVHSDSEWPL